MMIESPKDKNQEKGDEVLRRLLKTPPDHKTAKPKPNDGKANKSVRKERKGDD